MYKMAHAGHIGSSLSCAEILVFLKYAWMRGEDTFILSKGHAVAALYALLAEANALDPRELDTFYEDGTRLPALPPVNAIERDPVRHGEPGSWALALRRHGRGGDSQPKRAALLLPHLRR